MVLEHKWGDDRAVADHFRYVARFFKHPNYVKVDNRYGYVVGGTTRTAPGSVLAKSSGSVRVSR